MKYCMKCGTLLEDSHERCIGCGTDVSEPGTWSLYPPEMAKSIEIENKEKKSRMGLIAAMIAVFVLLVAAIAVFIVLNAKRIKEAEVNPVEVETESAEVVEATEPAETVDEAIEDVEAEEEEDGLVAPLQITEATKKEDTVDNTSADREIKDSAGSYYNIGTLEDLAGNVMFTTIFPEDFTEKAATIVYDIYSTRYPESLTYIAENKDGNVKFTYMSPQHFWYRKSDNKGQTRSYEYDINNYMQFLTYSGAEGYIEAIIKQSYTDIKGFKLIDKEELSPVVSEMLTKVSDDHTRELLGDIGDYAKIGSDTVYAAMQAECEASIYHYEATSRQENTIYIDVYVPIVANTLGYVSEQASDKGEVTEWVMPEFVAFEAGNEELHNHYEDAFKLFIYNSKLSDEFHYMNDAYSTVIEDAVKVKREPYKLSAEKLKALHSKYKPTEEINAFGKGIKEFLAVYPSECVKLSGDINVIADEKTKVGFYNKEKNKVFISPVEDEYPGSDYADLEYQEGSASSETAESSDSSDSE